MNTRSFSILPCLWHSFLYFSFIITCAYCYSWRKNFPLLTLINASWPCSSKYQITLLCPGSCCQITQARAFTVELVLLPWWTWSLQHFFQYEQNYICLALSYLHTLKRPPFLQFPFKDCPSVPLCHLLLFALSCLIMESISQSPLK